MKPHKRIDWEKVKGRKIKFADFLIPELERKVAKLVKKMLSSPKGFSISEALKYHSEGKFKILPKNLRRKVLNILRDHQFRSGKMQRMGLDIGTKNIVLAFEKNETIKFVREVNGFLIIEKGDGFTKSMLVNTGVPHVPREKDIVALGEKAEELAYSFGKELQRPMENGVLSIREKEAMQIMAVIIRSIIGKINDNILLYYCVPAAPINKESNVDFHGKIIDTIFKTFDDKNKIRTYSINEGRALVISSFEGKTGIGISFGAGMVNVSYCLFGLPVYQFSIVGAGDWIDRKAADATGENPVAITKVKESMALGKECPKENVERAIWIHYQLLIERVAKGIIEGFKRNKQKAKAPKPMPIVVAGGTSTPDGFVELFQDVFDKAAMPFKVGDITKAEKPLYSVAKGCLIAAQMHEE